MLSSPEDMLIDLREGEERERERERNTAVRGGHQSVASHMYPDWGLNHNLLVYGSMFPPTEPHQPFF